MDRLCLNNSYIYNPYINANTINNPTPLIILFPLSFKYLTISLHPSTYPNTLKNLNIIIKLNPINIYFNSIGYVEYWIGLIKAIYEPGIDIVYSIRLKINEGWFVE